jgi:hypothetical protein
LSFTWRWRAAQDPAEMLVTFMPLNDQETELTLVHERFPNVEERDSHETGWIGALEQLAAHVSPVPQA